MKMLRVARRFLGLNLHGSLVAMLLIVWSAIPLPRSFAAASAAPLMVFTRDRALYSSRIGGGPLRLYERPLAPVACMYDRRATPSHSQAGCGLVDPSVRWSSDGRYLLVEYLLDSPVQLLALRANGHPLQPLSRALDQVLGTAGEVSWANGTDLAIYQTAIPFSARSGRMGQPNVLGVSLTGQRRPVWPRRPMVPYSTTDCYLGESEGSSADPAAALLGHEQQLAFQPTFWESRRGIVFYDDGCNRRWHAANVRTGHQHAINIARSRRLAVSSGGLLAGVTTHSVVAERSSMKAEVALGRGYAPTWSRDGRWLYLVTRTRVRRLSFRLEVAPALWKTIQTSVYRCSVVRVHPDGTSRELVASQVGFGFADLNILTDGSVVFSRVGDDLNLWRHRRLGLTMRRVARYKPTVRIERAYLDHQVYILVHRGHDPVVQP